MSKDQAAAPPPSRRERKKQRTRREIYEAAMKLFAEEGYDAVSVETICDRADVARATFFAHFPTKASLLLEFSHALDARYEANALEHPENAAAELQHLCKIFAESWFEQSEVMSAMLREFVQTPGVSLIPIDELSPLHRRVAGIIARGQDSGEYRAELEPVTLAHFFLLTAATVMLGEFSREDQPSPEELIGRFLGLALHGFAR